MKLIIEPFSGLPCALKTFTINGKDANSMDFGDVYDHDNENAEPYGVVVVKETKKAKFIIKDEVFAVYKSKTFEEAFKLLEFADGMPFGIKYE